MKRRDLVVMIGSGVGITAGSWPVVIRAQGSSNPVVGFLGDGTPEGFAPRVAGVKRGLADAGFVEGRDVLIESRFAYGDYDFLPKLAGELIAQRVAVIVTAGTEKVVCAEN